MDNEGDKVRVTLRIEPDVYSMLLKAIEETGRSLNSEINARVRDSFCTKSPVVLTTTEKVLRLVFQEELQRFSTATPDKVKAQREANEFTINDELP